MKLGSVRETNTLALVVRPKEKPSAESVPQESFSISTTDVKCEFARPNFWQNVQVEAGDAPVTPPALPLPEETESEEDVRPAGDDADGPGVGGGYSGFYTLAGPMTSDGLLWYTNDAPKEAPKALPAPQEPVKKPGEGQEADNSARS